MANACIFLVALIVCGGFLLLLGVVAFAAARATRIGDAETGKRGCFGGCALICVLAFLGLLAVVGLGAVLVTTTGVAAVRANPVRSISIERGRLHQAVDDRLPVILTFTIAGELDDEIIDLIIDLVEARTDGELRPSVSVRDDPEAGPTTVVRIDLPLTERDLARIEREIEHEFDRRIHLPEGVRIELESQVGF